MKSYTQDDITNTVNPSGGITPLLDGVPVRFCKYGEWPSPIVTTYVADRGMPMAYYRWVPRQWVSLPLDTNFPSELSSDGKLRYCYAYRIDRQGEPVWNHMRLCNFRRYGWASSPTPPESNGHMFNGVIYANNVTGGLACSTIEQVIRETFVAHLGQVRVPDEIKMHYAVKPLYDDLVRDAIRWAEAHPDYHAGARIALRGGNGAVGDIKVNGVAHN